VLIKLDQLKLLITVSQSVFPWFWPSCHIIPNTCWVSTISVLTLVIIAAQKRKLMWSLLKMMLSSRPTQPLVDCLWSWSLHFQDKLYNSDNLYNLLVLFSWYCYWLFPEEVTICMKLDPGIHIVMHLILSLNPSVTLPPSFTHTTHWKPLSLSHLWLVIRRLVELG
jgi:hypothetical protein